MKIFVSILFLIMSQFVIAQLSKTDSLKQQLVYAKEDSNKIRLYISLCYPYLFNQPDSAFFYGEQALQLAKKIKFKKGEAESYDILWVPFFVKSEFATALDYNYKGLHLFEELKNELGVANAHMGLVNIYREQGDLKRALEHIFITKNLYEKLQLTKADYAINIHFNLAEIYEEDNLLDSALLHAQITLNLANSIKRTGNTSAVMYAVIGNVYRKKGNFTHAIDFYQMALPVFINLKIIKDQITTYNGIAASFLSLGQNDSALSYVQKAYQLGQPGNFLKGSLQTIELMSQVYKEKKLTDSALKYLEISRVLDNKIYSQEKEREVQSYEFNEQLRQQNLKESEAAYKREVTTYIVIAGFIAVILLAGILWRSNLQKQRAKTKIEHAYTELKSTQAQLIQSEKMASLGELTAGIAHEIQNPLNFVNNFSEVNKEMIDEATEEIDKGNIDEVKNILSDIKDNSEKINHHGKRADAIVKGMLQHSRSSTAVKEATDINALADEYLRLSYHGMRAKDKTFNVEIKTDFDNSIHKINIVPQDIGRVLLNLYNNAFYVVSEKSKMKNEKYKPTISVITKKINNVIELTVKDNGNGIPQKVVDKIFQPFFTTKPTGEGTGLGLSLSYDIVKAHGGEIKVETKESEGSEFIIQIPITIA